MQNLPPQEGTTSDAPVPGTFVPFHDSPRNGKRSARVGWIADWSGCHLWQGGRNIKGYGTVWVSGRTQLAHRARYEREVGPIPEGMHLDHFVCDNGPGGCCNPAHVRPVSPRENALRGNGPPAVNAAKTRCSKGHPLSGGNILVDRLRGLARGRRCLVCHRKRKRLAARRYRAERKRDPQAAGHVRVSDVERMLAEGRDG